MADWVEARRVPELAAAIAARQPAEQYDLGPEPPAPPVAAYSQQAPTIVSPYAQQSVGALAYHTQPRYNASAYAIPAGFWIRFVAAIVDGIILAIPNFVIGMISEVLVP